MRRKTGSIAAFCLGLFLCVWPMVAVGQAHIGKVVLGTGVNLDQSEIVNATTQFTPDTPRIYCLWKAEGGKVRTPVRGVWIAEDVGKAAPPNYKIDEATLNLPYAIDRGSFSVSKPNKGFPVGKYRLEIYAGNNLVKTVPFTVKAK